MPPENGSLTTTNRTGGSDPRAQASPPSAPTPRNACAPEPPPSQERPTPSSTDALGVESLPPDAYVKRRRSLLRRFAVLIAGSVVILGAILIGPLPGPGFLILGPLGLGILATEFEWARRVLGGLRSGATDIQTHTDRLTGGVSRIWILPVVVVYWFLVWQVTRWFAWPTQEVIWVIGISAFIPVAWMCYRVAVLRARKQLLRKLWNRIRERRRARHAALRRARTPTD